MRTSIVFAFAALATVVTGRSEIIPAETKTPLFQLYEMQLLPHKGRDPHTHQMKLGKVLLTVRTLQNLSLLPDGRGVVATLIEIDTKAFSRLTHTHDYMILLAGDQESSVVMHISGPIDDGVIPFTDANYSTHVGGYLLRRCRKSPNPSLQPPADRSNQ